MKINDMVPHCELCTREATLYCAADSAFLCNTCDSSVHGANFIVARHLRQPLCPHCGSLYSPGTSCCHSCVMDCLSPISSSSGCLSTTESITNRSSGGCDKIRRQKGVNKSTAAGVSSSCVTEVSLGEGGGSKVRELDGKEERVLRSWWRRLLSGDEREIVSHHHEAVVVPAAVRTVRMCMGVLPMRVALAAAFWVALRMSIRRMPLSVPMSMSLLGRLEEICGVPARVILMTAERRVARLFRAATATGSSSKQKGCHHNLQEGWGES